MHGVKTRYVGAFVIPALKRRAMHEIEALLGRTIVPGNELPGYA